MSCPEEALKFILQDSSQTIDQSPGIDPDVWEDNDNDIENPIPNLTESGRNDATNDATNESTTKHPRTRSQSNLTNEEIRVTQPNRELKGLNTFFNPIQMEDHDDPGSLIVLSTVSTDSLEPSTIQQALSGPDQEKWKQSIKDEIDNFLNGKAWVKVPMTTVQQEEKIPVGTKTVFKIKNEHLVR